MFIDGVPADTARRLYDEIQNSPVKVARQFFPDRPAGYVKATKSIGAYFINRYIGLDLIYKNDDNWKTYAKICADIWCELPSWATEISLTNGTE